jgi:hypothetical protein
MRAGELHRSARGRSGSVFKMELAPPGFPDSLLTTTNKDCGESKGWAAVGVEGGIPAVTEIAARVRPGDDIQAVLKAQPPPADPSRPAKYRVVLLERGCYQIKGGTEKKDLLSVPPGVILRGEDRDGVVLSFYTENGEGNSSISVNGSAGWRTSLSPTLSC